MVAFYESIKTLDLVTRGLYKILSLSPPTMYNKSVRWPKRARWIRAVMRDHPFITERGFPKPSVGDEYRGEGRVLRATGYCRGNYPRYPLFPLYGGGVPIKGNCCFYHLKRALSRARARAHGTLLVRAIKKRNAAWSRRATPIGSRIVGMHGDGKKGHRDVVSESALLLRTYDATRITDGD